MQLHRAKLTQDDKWRVLGYTKAIAALRRCSERVSSIEQARSLNGVGEKTALKIMEIIETGALRRVDAERTEDVAAIQLFQGIYGVGPSTAYAWYFAGCRTLEDIKERKGGIELSSVQVLGLKYYDDINTRMPREEASEIFGVIKSIALSLDPKLFIEIMGSYRRGKATCGDIDIMITRSPDDGKTHAGILSRLLSALRSAGIITEDLSLSSDANHSVECSYRGLCMRPPTTGQDTQPRIRRRIDILAIPWESRGAALIYFTFNRSIRLKANKMGYSLNQRGLFADVVRSTGDRSVKTNAGHIIASETEEEIFRTLGVPWLEPHERAVRG
ncbi:Nucleotidyltransferase [Russula aff. rugulosa BPL654]|nr:Nucleotidyltransferase [Russula aff. rugulosa BPL654]